MPVGNIDPHSLLYILVTQISTVAFMLLSIYNSGTANSTGLASTSGSKPAATLFAPTPS